MGPSLVISANFSSKFDFNKLFDAILGIIESAQAISV